MINQALTSSAFFDFETPVVQQFLRSSKAKSTEELMLKLYLRVRDEIKYDPFAISFDQNDLKASRVIEQGYGHCIHKSVLLIAAARAIGVPAKLGLARVRNHMGTSRLEKILQTDVLNPHGYVELFMHGKWVKCTPAFNKQLCERLGVQPLEFDGHSDSVFQQFDRQEKGFMEYLQDHGQFNHVPIAFLKEQMQLDYPHLFDEEGAFLNELLR
jgi:transglutaminase-like putative cysteine protease